MLWLLEHVLSSIYIRSRPFWFWWCVLLGLPFEVHWGTFNYMQVNCFHLLEDSINFPNLLSACQFQGPPTVKLQSIGGFQFIVWDPLPLTRPRINFRNWAKLVFSSCLFKRVASAWCFSGPNSSPVMGNKDPGLKILQPVCGFGCSNPWLWQDLIASLISLKQRKTADAVCLGSPSVVVMLF